MRRSRRSARDESDDGRRHRPGRRAHDPDRRPLARRLRIVQLPRLRPRARDHRRGRAGAARVGYASELVAAPREPGAVRADRDASHRAPRVRGLLALPTITHIHSSTIPVLAGSGTIFLDSRAHKTIYDGCEIARAHGATVRRFRSDDPDDLERCCARIGPRCAWLHGRRQQHERQRAEAARFPRVVRAYDALLYIDDAHGFGVIGERRPTRRARTGHAATSSATSARATTTSSSSAASRRRTRRCSPSSPVRPSSRTCSRSRRRRISTRARRPLRRSRPCSRAST